MKTADTHTVSTIQHETRDIELTLIDPSPYQPRKHFGAEELEELKESILRHGQLDFAIVRPMPNGRMELIAGERRMRACDLGGLKTLRCQIREMTDAEAMELVIIQQVQHAQWTTLEEAAGYRDLLALRDQGKPRFTYATLAARINKSESHIRDLVTMLDAPAALCEALAAGEVSKRTVTIVGGLLPEQREEAAQRVLRPDNQTHALNTRQTIAMVQERFMRSLQAAPFSTKDDTLVPEAGSCEACQYRTGKMPIYSGGGGRGLEGPATSSMHPNLCTKPECYRAKCTAIEARDKQRAMDKGREIMPDEEAAKLFDADGELKGNIDYVDMGGKPDPTLCHHFDLGKMPTWKKLLTEHGARDVKVWVAKNPVTGDLHDLINQAEAIRSINERSREKTGEAYFKGAKPESAPQDPVPSTASVGRSVFDTADDETIRPGDHIMLPEESQNELWDKSAEREAKAEQREKDRTKAERLQSMMARMHVRLPDDLLDSDRGPKIKRLFAQHMLQVIGAELVVDDMCRYYGLQAETEESLDDLLKHYDKLNAFESTTFVMMTLIRRFGHSYGPDSETLAEWREVLGIEEEDAETRSEGEGEKEKPRFAPDDTSVGAKLFSALHGFAGASERWHVLKEHGVSDEGLKASISEEFGINTGSSAHGGYSATGGKEPKFFPDYPAKDECLKGKPLLSLVRKLMELPMPKDLDSGTEPAWVKEARAAAEGQTPPESDPPAEAVKPAKAPKKAAEKPQKGKTAVPPNKTPKKAPSGKAKKTAVKKGKSKKGPRS